MCLLSFHYRVKMTFLDRDGDEQIVDAKVGDTLLEVAKEFDIDLEGACEGTLSCSTCHLVIDPEWYDKIPDPLTEEEQDMLDLAYGLTDTYVNLILHVLCEKRKSVIVTPMHNLTIEE
jgi:2Fe-2S ferredoxin